MLSEKLLFELILAFVFGSIFILGCWYLYKKRGEEKAKLFEAKIKLLGEQVVEHKIYKAQLMEEYKQKQFFWDDKFARKIVEFQQLQKNNEEHIIKDRLLQEKYDKELHFRKSSEVRLGKIGENLAPFLNGWPWSARQFRFLGNPVDGIQFNDDGIIFVEIKTGKARLSKSQKKAKELVKQGKVSFVTFKITDDGTKLIREN